MIIPLSPKSFFIFDLDDTLFLEMDYLKSAYKQIAGKLSEKVRRDIYDEMMRRFNQKENVFEWIIKDFGNLLPEYTIETFLNIYRVHQPEIALSKETGDFLASLKKRKVPMGLITDGRSITQRNKLKALGIDKYFEDVIISEEFGSAKPDPRNFEWFEKKYPDKDFWFIGDNTSKDFIIPDKLGWKTICIRDGGMNVHSQNIDQHPVPHYLISSFSEIELNYHYLPRSE